MKLRFDKKTFKEFINELPEDNVTKSIQSQSSKGRLKYLKNQAKEICLAIKQNEFTRRYSGYKVLKTRVSNILT